MNDVAWMGRALALAEGGRYTAAPNPLVGCVLVHDGAVVGEGYHRRAGEGTPRSTRCSKPARRPAAPPPM